MATTGSLTLSSLGECHKEVSFLSPAQLPDPMQVSEPHDQNDIGPGHQVGGKG